MGEGKNLVGVDIGSSAIKVCQVKERRGERRLVRVGFQELPPQTVVDGQVVDAGTVIESLQRVFRDAKIRQRDVSISVSGQTVIIRKITVPMMTPSELAEQVPWEAEQHIPFDIKDVCVDYQVLRQRPESSQMELLLVAAKRDQINEFARLVRDARLKPRVCDIDAFSIQNLFEVSRQLPQDRIIALINVGANLSSLNIVASGVSAFTREIANGGKFITEEIQKQTGAAYEQAEQMKCSAGTAGISAIQTPPQVLEIIDSVADSIAAEIQRSLDFFLATSGEGDISQIYLTGGSSSLPALTQAIERRARVSVEPWLPTESFIVDPKEVEHDTLGARAPQLSVALGLALRKQREMRA